MNKNKFLLVLCAGALLASCGGNNPGPDSQDSSSESSAASSSSSSSSTSTGPVTELQGSGTAADPYQIGTAGELEFFQDNVVSDAYYVVTADIDASEIDWVGVGTITAPFAGVFNGQGHKISGIAIDDFSTDVKAYGFFGYTSTALISNLKMEMSVSLSFLGKSTTYVFGGLVGFGENTTIDNVHVEFESVALESYQNNNSNLSIGGIAGLLSISSEDNPLYVELKNSSVIGDIQVDLTNSDSVLTYLGGIAGMVDTGYYEGIYSCANLLYDGYLTGGDYLGGITGSLGNYGSISNSVVKAEGIYATAENGCYAGGIAGYAAAETMLYGNYVDVEVISAAESSAGHYPSFAGDIVAIAREDGYEENSDFMGAGFYKNYVKETLDVSSDEVGTQGEAEELTSTLLTNMGFQSSVWDLDAVTVKKTAQEAYNVTLTIDMNGAGGASVTKTVAGNTYDVNYAGTIAGFDAPERELYSYYGLSYDPEGTVMARWYVPTLSDVTLYAAYASLESLVGDYAYTCYYYESPITHGNWKFTEDSFYWINSTGMSSSYTYTFNGKYVFIGEYTGDPEGVKMLDGYAGAIFRMKEDGHLEAYDCNSDDAIFKASKTSTPVVVPDYSTASFLGDWKGVDSAFTLTQRGNVIGAKTGRPLSVDGYTATGNTVHMSLSGVIYPAAIFTHDALHGLLIGDNQIFSRSEIKALAATSDNSLRLIDTGDKLYPVVNNQVTSDLVSGSIEEGGTVAVGSTSYRVSNGVLTEITPESEAEIIANIYEATLSFGGDEVSLLMTLTKQGEGSLVAGSETVATFEFAYVSLTNTITISNFSSEAGYDSLSLEYQAATETFTGSGTKDGAAFTLTAKIYVEPTPSVTSIEGVYSGTYRVFANDFTFSLYLYGDGSGKGFDESRNEIMTFTYVFDPVTADIAVTNFVVHDENDSYFSSLQMEIDLDTKTITGSGFYNYDYTDYEYTFSVSYSGEIPAPAIDVDTVAGTYVGTWGTSHGQTACTIALTAEGKGSFTNSSGMTIFTFDWTLEPETGALTITNFSDSTDSYENLRLTYDDGSLNGFVYENNMMMDDFTITTSKVA